MVILHDVVVQTETDKALLVIIDGQEHWIPRSQIVDSESDVLAVGDSGTLAITDWIAKQKGLD